MNETVARISGLSVVMVDRWQSNIDDWLTDDDVDTNTID